MNNKGEKMKISEYIKNEKAFFFMPYMSVYKTICQLIKDGYIIEGTFEESAKDVEDIQPKSMWEICR